MKSGHHFLRYILLLSVIGMLRCAALAQAQVPVIDNANLIQNIEQLVRLIEQLRDMAMNSAGIAGIWSQALPTLERYALTQCQREAVVVCDPALVGELQQRWPGFVPTNSQWGPQYQRQVRTVLDTMEGAVRLTQQHRQDFAVEDARLQELSRKSELTTGRLQAAKTTNMFAAEQVRQLLSVRQALLTQINLTAVYQFQKQSEEAQRNAKTQEWLTGLPVPPTLPVYGTQGVGRFTAVQQQNVR